MVPRVPWLQTANGCSAWFLCLALGMFPVSRMENLCNTPGGAPASCSCCIASSPYLARDNGMSVPLYLVSKPGFFPGHVSGPNIAATLQKLRQRCWGEG